VKVTLVLDVSYGERLAALAPPAWVCDSRINRPVIERLWSKPNNDPMALTLFTRIGESDDEACADIVPTIDQHHPEWTELTVIGALATAATRECFTSLGPGEFVESSEGFAFVRSGLP
jgi:hypothetical protein